VSLEIHAEHCVPPQFGFNSLFLCCTHIFVTAMYTMPLLDSMPVENSREKEARKGLNN